MTDPHNLTICIPAFNEAQAMSRTLCALRMILPDAEIIVVDDGSSDGTSERAREVPGVIVIVHERNRGYGAAIKTAIRHSTRPVVAWYDADGQHRPEDLLGVVEPVLSGKADAVIGVRGRGSHVRRDRLPGKALLTIVAEAVVHAYVPDLNSGLRCFRREVIMRYLHLLPDGFSASSTSTVIMMKRGYRLGHVGITTAARTGVSSVRMLRDGFRTIHLLLRLLVLFDAFKFFSMLGGLQVATGLIYGLTVAWMMGLGFPVLGAVVILSGIMTFLMGLLCDQIVALRLERMEGMRFPDKSV